MIYYLTNLFIENYSAFNIFKYITFRSGLAAGFALLFSIIFGPKFIAKMRAMQPNGQPIRADGPQTHLESKKGTPTMGGLLIITSVVISCLLFCDLSNKFIWISLFVLTSLGALGFADDYLKISKTNSAGVSGKKKLIFQLIISIIACYAIQASQDVSLHNKISLPFFKGLFIDIGLFYLIFVFLVITGSSNAVNLTDGLDGLVSGPIAIAFGCFAIISYLSGHAIFADYLKIKHVMNASELTIFCSSMVGAALGFLWFNAPPAKIFMGDVGSLAIGGSLGVVSVITKHEFTLAIIGGLFVIEAVSVMLQVYYFKITKGKRLFLMAPIHHHFEKKGWPETTVVIRFWIIAIIFAIIGLATLKIR